MTDMWGDLVWAALADLKTRLILVLPGILAMLTLAVVGLVGAWIAARVTRRIAQAVAFDRRAESWGIVAQLNRAGVQKPPSQVLGLIVFWSILVLFLSMAIDALAIPGTGRITEIFKCPLSPAHFIFYVNSLQPAQEQVKPGTKVLNTLQ